jgi:hypothetical protein
MFGNNQGKPKNVRLVKMSLVVYIEGFLNTAKYIVAIFVQPLYLRQFSTSYALGHNPQAQTYGSHRGGNADEGSLKMPKLKGYDLLCVTRSRLKDYVADNNHGQPIIITPSFLSVKHY